MRTTSLTALLLGTLLCVWAPTAGAQVTFGVRAGEYTDVGEPMIGVELLTRIAPRWYFNPNIEYVFVDDGDLVTLNADFHRDFATGTPTIVWVGAGLAVVHENFAESDTNLGANVLAGAGWRLREILPYVQVKALIGDRHDFVVAGGIRF